MASYGIPREEAKKETIGPGRCNGGSSGLLWWIGWGCRISRFKCAQSRVTVHMPSRVRYRRTGWMLSLANKLTVFIVIYRGSSATSALVTFLWRWWSRRSHHPYDRRCHCRSFQMPNLLDLPRQGPQIFQVLGPVLVQYSSWSLILCYGGQDNNATYRWS